MSKPNNTTIKLIEEYQCPGCVCGSDIKCYKKGNHIECEAHVAGTTITPGGKIMLGMPTGFNKTGEAMQFNIFESFSDGWGYSFLNSPVWKSLDKNGNTLVRGISPRINLPFLHIFKGNCLSKIDCYELSIEDIEGMD